MNPALRSGLIEVPGALSTFASAGLEAPAEVIGRIAASSFDYLAGLLDRRPDAQVLVLSEADWREKGRNPLYGLPNAAEGTLIVAGTEAPFWSSLIDMAGEDGQAAMAATYAGADGVIGLAGFFDLVAVHEVAHLFSEDVVDFPRLWLMELFANLCLHAWVEQCAPASLPTLLTLPRLASRASADAFERRTRAEFEEFYTAMEGPNYVWYQFRLQMAAADLYRNAGEAVVRRLFDAFHVAPGAPPARAGEYSGPSLDDEALAALLAASVDPGLGAFSLAL